MISMNITTKPTLIAIPDGASLLDVLAARHRAAWDKTQHGRAEWIEGTLELAAVLAEERKAIPADQEYSRWLERHGLAELSKDDRYGLKAIAADPDAAKQVMESDKTISWVIIGRLMRVRNNSTPQRRGETPKKRSKSERQIIERVLNLHCERGFSYDQTAAELGLTKGQVAGIVHRNRNNGKAEVAAVRPAPRPISSLDSKTLTREQVDPDFEGDAVQFAAKYGHVLLHTKEQLEEHKRQEDLMTWLAAISDLERTVRTFIKAEAPDQNTLRHWLTKPGKAEKLGARLTLIESAWQSIAPCLDIVRSQEKSP
jgi:hypothetical protein